MGDRQYSFLPNPTALAVDMGEGEPPDGPSDEDLYEWFKLATSIAQHQFQIPFADALLIAEDVLVTYLSLLVEPSHPHVWITVAATNAAKHYHRERRTTKPERPAILQSLLEILVRLRRKLRSLL